MITFWVAVIAFIMGAVIAMALMEKCYLEIADIYEKEYKKKARELERKYMHMVNQNAKQDIFKEF